MSFSALSPEDLPGYKKKSFAMNFSGGEIWFEHLDGIYEHEHLVLEKLNSDKLIFQRPSMPSLIAVNIDETEMSDRLIAAITDALCNTAKRITRVVFVAADSKTRKKLKKEISSQAHFFALNFIDDFEKAKEWLVSEKI